MHFILEQGVANPHVAQKETFAAQSRIENQWFFVILGVFLQFFGVLRPKKSIF